MADEFDRARARRRVGTVLARDRRGVMFLMALLRAEWDPDEALVLIRFTLEDDRFDDIGDGDG